MERLQSPTTELSEELGALRLGQLQESTSTHKVCSQALTEGPSLSTVTSDFDSTFRERDDYSEQGGGGGGVNSRQNRSIVPLSGPACVIDSNHSNQIPLVFSHLELTQDGTDSSTCVGVSCGIEQDRHQTCQNCGQRHVLTEDTLCSASSPCVSGAETLLNGLQSLSVSSTEVANGNYHPASERGVEMAPEHSCCAASNSLSDNLTHWAWSHRYSSEYASRSLCHSCRSEAVRVDCLDDVTVDELAGYFDQLLYLPRPMSEMAELMYT